MSESDDSSRRSHRWVETNIDVRISTIEPERDAWTGRALFRATNATCGNVSSGGAFVLTSEPLHPGRQILLEMRLPSGRPIEAIGRVAWSKRSVDPCGVERASGIGVEFIGGSTHEFKALHALIETASWSPTSRSERRAHTTNGGLDAS